jgi:lipoprotein signal peptidase
MLTGKYRLMLVVLLLVVGVDQVSKHLILAHVGLHENITIIPGFFDIVHVKNPGAAFGLFAQQAPAIRNAVLISASFIAIGIISVSVSSEPGDVSGTVCRICADSRRGRRQPDRSGPVGGSC